MKAFLKSDEVSFLTSYHTSYDVIADFLDFFNFDVRASAIMGFQFVQDSLKSDDVSFLTLYDIYVT